MLKQFSAQEVDKPTLKALALLASMSARTASGLSSVSGRAPHALSSATASMMTVMG